MDEQLYHRFFEIEESHWWFVARQAIVEDLVTRILLLRQSAKVLDVGCGTGALLRKFSDRYEAYGTDTSETAIEYCRTRGLKNVYCCTVKDFPLSDLRFDLVTMLDVIEHVDDDSLLLREAGERLAPNGSIVITVPAYQFLWGPHDIANHHKRRYTRRLLKSVMERSGFVVEELSYMNTVLFPLALIQRLIESTFPKRGNASLVMPRKPVNALLTTIFASERHLLRMASLPFGLSVVGIGRKG